MVDPLKSQTIASRTAKVCRASLFVVVLSATSPLTAKAGEVTAKAPQTAQGKTVIVPVELQPWQKRRAEFTKIVQGVQKGDVAAQKALVATLTEVETHPFIRTPIENMEILGVFYLPRDGVEKVLPIIAINAVLGWYDALRFASESGRAEIAQNEGFFKKAFIVWGNDGTPKAIKFMQDNPEQTAKLVEVGLKLAEPLKDDPRYDHRWPSAYGLERMICAQGGSCAPPPELQKDQWNQAWSRSRQQVSEYYKSAVKQKQ